ncbi:beta-N-acetylhexosaminidase [Macrococcoides caseolyticum]|uniref:beta-N-acetylhexosaminidase n=1 Tax=Macrococcoides caseolyticum TaxID=69966 RepID=UPI001F23046F|nr:beta-N-acetylhexosaminidase [Macrococcus caseolyticus]MCE4956224.1 beta-N-acetylhexosaminidase [Macrococcus caseolyticus]
MKKRLKLLCICLTILLTGCKAEYTTQVADKGISVKHLGELSMIPYLIDQMTLEEKIAQHFLLGFHGTTYNNELEKFNQMKIGGVILFTRNIESAYQTRMLNRDIEQNHRGIKMFIAVDQEGGRVNRLPKELVNIEPAIQISQSGSQQYAYNKGEYIGQQLKDLNFNVDFAPVFDIWSNPQNKVIGDRSFGTDAKDVIRYAIPFNRGINDQSIITSAKHFPGHGDTFVDSHETLPVSHISKAQLFDRELKPFEAAIDANIDMIMVSHILFPKIDAKYPSSMSRAMVTGILRDKLDYQGVIITDDLAMGAIANGFSREEAVLYALNAGETMILMGSDIGDINQLVQYIKSCVTSGRLDEKIIDRNVEKILKLKQKYGIV